MNLLFDIEEEATPDIAGLAYWPECISREEEQALLKHIDDRAYRRSSKPPGPTPTSTDSTWPASNRKASARSPPPTSVL
jgi:hypothetical protein